VTSVADVTIDIDTDIGNTSATIDAASSSLDDLDSAAGGAASGLDDAGAAGREAGSRMDAVGVGALGASAALAGLGDITQQASDLWNIAERRADDLAQAEIDVEQASMDMEQAQRDATQAALDLEQANIDLEQATLDVNQAQIDGAQAGLDVEQAAIDARQAQEDYTEAVEEFGKNSIEAEQAALDLKQADLDSTQAKEDAKQATEDAEQAMLDAKQATEDYGQATADGEQALLDGRQAQLDLNAAQRNMVGPEVMGSWIGMASSVGSAVFGLIGMLTLLRGGMLAGAAASVASAATTAVAWVGSWIAMGIAAMANALVMAAAWIVATGGLILIVAAVIALVALVIANWDTVKSVTVAVFTAVWDFLVGVWNGITGFIGDAIGTVKGIFMRFHPLGIFISNWGSIKGWVSGVFDDVVSTVTGLPGRISRAASGMFDGIKSAARSAFNGVAGLWNSSVGSLSFKVPGWVPGMGGKGFSMPTIPTLAEGGITTGPTLAMIGEGREQEAVLPLSKLRGLMDMRGGGTQRVVIDVNGGEDAFVDFIKAITRTAGGGSIIELAEG
jgi:hypothetical protein